MALVHLFFFLRKEPTSLKEVAIFLMTESLRGGQNKSYLRACRNPLLEGEVEPHHLRQLHVVATHAEDELG